MYPVLFRIGDFAITTFGLMMFLSFIGGAYTTSRMLKRYGLDPELIWDMLAWIAIGGIAGAKLYYLALHSQDLFANPVKEIFARGGLVWYGGLFGGVLAYYIQVKRRGLPLPVMFDATAPALMVAIALGRLGCFLVGDDYGKYTTGPFGLAFPQGAPPTSAGTLRNEFGDSVPASIPDTQIVTVHPTQLYEIALVLPLFYLLWQLGKRGLRPGQLFAVFLGVYAVERFFIEIVRAKGDRYLLGLSTSQIVSIVLVGVGIWLWNRQKTVPVWDPTTAPPRARTKPPKSAA